MVVVFPEMFKIKTVKEEETALQGTTKYGWVSSFVNILAQGNFRLNFFKFPFLTTLSRL